MQKRELSDQISLLESKDQPPLGYQSLGGEQGPSCMGLSNVASAWLPFLIKQETKLSSLATLPGDYF